jgi:hypothetical protein
LNGVKHLNEATAKIRRDTMRCFLLVSMTRSFTESTAYHRGLCFIEITIYVK